MSNPSVRPLSDASGVCASAARIVRRRPSSTHACVSGIGPGTQPLAPEFPAPFFFIIISSLTRGLLSLPAGVSCDACLKGNFRGRRFKCLICYDYDLCASCYESGATTTRHTTEHPMQCILTRVDYGKSGVAVPAGGRGGSPPVTAAALCPCRPVLWRGHVLGGAAPVLHLSLLWQDGLHGDLPAGPRHLGARRNVHGGGECRPLPQRDRRACAHAEAREWGGGGPAHMGATFPRCWTGSSAHGCLRLSS